MNKLTIQLFLFLAIPTLCVGGMLFFGYQVYVDLQTLKTQVAWLSNTGTSTSPLMQAAGAGVRENYAALCVLMQHPQVCQAAGMPVQTSPVPVPNPQK
jgi:hypothetical protein